MKQKSYTKTAIINLSHELIHLALNNRFDEFMKYVSEDFVYIADYDALYTHGRDSFAKIAMINKDQPPIEIDQEEYEILTHDRSLWITFGRIIAESTQSDKITITTKFHFTLTLKNIDGELKLIHAMACHIPDVTAEEEQRVTKSMLFGKSTNFRKIQVKENPTAQKLFLHDPNGAYYYLYPNEILYFKADDHRCIVHTTNSSFACSAKLQSFSLPSFYHVSKSYLVNTLYVSKIERYKVTMTNGSQLPISRPKYMEFKEILQGKKQ